VPAHTIAASATEATRKHLAVFNADGVTLRALLRKKTGRGIRELRGASSVQ
jgi:hypothetical protein